ncbi:MAG: Gfo/Idh/MocA family oxidoreductase [Planctomycetota bacterium]|nr:Gfo/Idh/MocA family oxidoreductase [Planctomycetota bacterium]
MTTSRRTFIAAASAVSAAGIVAPFAIGGTRAQSATRTINIGLVGCGGRGAGSANDSLTANPNVRLVAMADITSDKAKSARDELKKVYGDRIDVPESRIFEGLDGYKEVIALADVDIVMFATSPGFRPRHIQAAVDAKKHVFAEKPTCTDPVGYRICCDANDKAKAQGTAIVTGTQYRRQSSFVQGIARIREGMIGDVLSMTARYCSGPVWYRGREGGMSDAQYQIFNWMHFVWLSGDQPAEQAVHNLDVVHWVMGGPPETCFASGGRFTKPEDSEMWDSCSATLAWSDGRFCDFKSRQLPQSASDHDNVVYGSKGTAFLRAFNSGTQIFDRSGKELFSVKGDIGAAYQQEHKDLVNSIIAGKPIVELRQTAESSLMAIMAREAGYSGQKLNWDWIANQSKLNLFPQELDLAGSLPTPFVRVPGTYELV